MSILADGTLELQDPDNGIDFYIAVGGLDDYPVVRGENVILPSKPGETWMPKVEGHMPVTLHGYVEGQGSTAADRRIDYRDLMDSIRLVFSPTASPFTIAVLGGSPLYNEGLLAGETATITVEFLRFTGPVDNGLVREFDIECRAIADSPTWDVTEDSSS